MSFLFRTNTEIFTELKKWYENFQIVKDAYIQKLNPNVNNDQVW